MSSKIKNYWLKKKLIDIAIKKQETKKKIPAQIEFYKALKTPLEKNH